MAAVAYTLLQMRIEAVQGSGSRLAAAVGGDLKGNLSLGLFAVAIPLAFFQPWIADGIYVPVALMWLVPDPRIESRVRE